MAESFDYAHDIKSSFATDEVRCLEAINSALKNLPITEIHALQHELASDEDLTYRLCESIKLKRNPIVTCKIITGITRKHNGLSSYLLNMPSFFPWARYVIENYFFQSLCYEDLILIICGIYFRPNKIHLQKLANSEIVELMMGMLKNRFQEMPPQLIIDLIFPLHFLARIFLYFPQYEIEQSESFKKGISDVVIILFEVSLQHRARESIDSPDKTGLGEMDLMKDIGWWEAMKMVIRMVRAFPEVTFPRKIRRVVKKAKHKLPHNMTTADCKVVDRRRSYQICDFCGKKARKHNFPMCERCCIARYCSRKCQKKAYSKHKNYCERMAALRS